MSKILKKYTKKEHYRMDRQYRREKKRLAPGQHPVKLKPKTNYPKAAEKLKDQIIEAYLEAKNIFAEFEEAKIRTFKKHFNFGKLLFESEREIRDRFESWAAFARYSGLNYQTLNRYKKAYEAFHWKKIRDADGAVKMLKEKEIEPDVRFFNRSAKRQLEGHIYEPPPYKTRFKQSRLFDTDLEELEVLSKRAQLLVDRHEPDSDIYYGALETVKFTNESIDHMKQLKVTNRQWHNEEYLNFIRGLNWDALSKQPVKHPEPHHVDPNNPKGTGPLNSKMADVFAIPLSGYIHRKITNKQLEFSREQLLEALVETMALFIMTALPDQKNHIEEAEYEEIE